jgi:hypothetical protein
VNTDLLETDTMKSSKDQHRWLHITALLDSAVM